jgi:hypothetical protein
MRGAAGDGVSGASRRVAQALSTSKEKAENSRRERTRIIEPGVQQGTVIVRESAAPPCIPHRAEDGRPSDAAPFDAK